MCGIVGIVKFDPQETIEEARIQRTRDVLFHRGPDGGGLWVEGPVALGHRRLAIVDVAGGHQPMSNEDGSVWIVFNGEIYNHPDLQPQLEARGHRYRTRSDTETILHLYEDEGDRVVERLRGMFAFAIWDRMRRRLLLARDRLGIKPLYYACTDRELLFASEIKAILQAGSLRPTFNEAVLPEFLATRFVSSADTFFHGVRKLLPGQTLSWSPGTGLETRRYWHVSAHASETPTTLPQQARALRARFESAVQSHLMSDVPLGVFLSGGIDSTALAGLVARMASEPISTFAVGFSDPRANELAYARLAARRIGAQHHEVVVSPSEYFAALSHLIWHEDEPIAFPSSIPLYFVSRLARAHVKVVLTGEGADELFLGYNRYRVTYWNERLGRAYRAVVPQTLRRPAQRAVAALPRRLRRYTERSFLALDAGCRALFFENFAVFPEPARRRLLRQAELLDRDPYEVGVRCYEEAAGGTLERMSCTDLQTYLVELLMKQDQMSMAASVESRVPYLDHEFVEHVLTVPDRFKLRGWQTKAVLRAAVSDLVPPEILRRPKMGFPVPIGAWLRGEFWPLVEEFVLGPRALARGWFDRLALGRLAAEHRAGAADHGDQLWLLLNLEIWHRIFCDGEDPAAIMPAVWRRSAVCAFSG